MRSTNPCGNAHFKNKPCRVCDRIRASRKVRGFSKDDLAVGVSEVQDSGSVIPASKGEGPTDKAKAREPIDDTVGGSADAPQPLKASRGGKRVVEPLSPAERQRLWRTTGDVEGKRKSNTERMAAKRGQHEPS